MKKNNLFFFLFFIPFIIIEGISGYAHSQETAAATPEKDAKKLTNQPDYVSDDPRVLEDQLSYLAGDSGSAKTPDSPALEPFTPQPNQTFTGAKCPLPPRMGSTSITSDANIRVGISDAELDCMGGRVSRNTKDIGILSDAFAKMLEDSLRMPDPNDRLEQLEEIIRNLEDDLRGTWEQLRDDFNRIEDVVGQKEPPLDPRVDDLRIDINQVHGNVSQVERDMGGLYENMDALRARMQEIERLLNGIRSAMAGVLTPSDTGPAIERLQVELNKLSLRLDGVRNTQATPASTSDLQDKYNELQKNYMELQNKVSDLVTKINELRADAREGGKGHSSSDSDVDVDVDFGIGKGIKRIFGRKKPQRSGAKPDKRIPVLIKNLQDLKLEVSALRTQLNQIKTQTGQGALPPPPGSPLPINPNFSPTAAPLNTMPGTNPDFAPSAPPSDEPDAEITEALDGIEDTINQIFSRLEILEQSMGESSGQFDDSKLWAEIDDIWELVETLKGDEPEKAHISIRPSSGGGVDPSELDLLNKRISQLFDIINEIRPGTVEGNMTDQAEIEKLQQQVRDHEREIERLKSRPASGSGGGSVNVNNIANMIEARIMQKIEGMIPGDIDGMIQAALAEFRSQMEAFVKDSLSTLPNANGSADMQGAVDSSVKQLELKLTELSSEILLLRNELESKDNENDAIDLRIQEHFNSKLNPWIQSILEKMSSQIENFRAVFQKYEAQLSDHEKRINRLEELLRGKTTATPVPAPAPAPVAVPPAPKPQPIAAETPVGSKEWEKVIVAQCQKEAELMTAQTHCTELYGAADKGGFSPQQCLDRSKLGSSLDAVLASTTQAKFVACKEERLKNPTTPPKPEARFNWKNAVSPSFLNRLELKKQRDAELASLAKTKAGPPIQTPKPTIPAGTLPQGTPAAPAA